MDIKCRYSGLIPDVVVLVATIRALKMHGGGPKVVAGQPLDQGVHRTRIWICWKRACPTWCATSRTRNCYGVPVVVAVNSFQGRHRRRDRTDPQASLGAGGREDGVQVRRTGRTAAKGAIELAEAVMAAAKQTPRTFEFLYPLEWTHQSKRSKRLRRNSTAPTAWTTRPRPKRRSNCTRALGFDKLPICMAKTHLSLHPRSEHQRRADRLPHSHPRHPRERGRGLPVSACRLDAHHAGPAHASGVL